jgi:hypothetical protein
MILKKFHICIYQRPSGDVLIVVKNLYYLIDFPSFNVKSGYNGQSIENLEVSTDRLIIIPDDLEINSTNFFDAHFSGGGGNLSLMM